MSDFDESTRRQNDRTAQIIQYGITLQFIAGAQEARRYLKDHGIPVHVIERVLSMGAAARHSHNGVVSNDRRQK
jgi:hypothetical protein